MIFDWTYTDAVDLHDYHGGEIVEFRAGRIGAVMAPTIPGLEFTLPVNRPHWTLEENRLHFTVPVDRMHFEIPEED